MTTTTIRKAIKQSGKSVSLTHLYRLFKTLNIQPIGRSRPQQYPDDTPTVILSYLGFSTGSVVQGKENAGGMLKRTGNAGCEVPALPVGKLISVRALRAVKPQPKSKGTK